MTASLTAKMKLRPGARAAVLHATPGYLQSLAPLPEGVHIEERLAGRYGWLQVFVRNQAELQALAPHLTAALEPDGLLWITFPKGGSGMQTDLTRDRGWEALHCADLKWVNLISVDDVWSAFSLRPYRPGEPRQSFR